MTSRASDLDQSEFTLQDQSQLLYRQLYNTSLILRVNLLLLSALIADTGDMVQ